MVMPFAACDLYPCDLFCKVSGHGQITCGTKLANICLGPSKRFSHDVGFVDVFVLPKLHAESPEIVLEKTMIGSDNHGGIGGWGVHIFWINTLLIDNQMDWYQSLICHI